jgi:thiol:disulfide interchange protein DsbD
MFGFSLAFAIPFTLFALFPSWLKKMPKSGAWLNSIKIVLGFIILAFSLKFLSTISQTYHLDFMPRSLFLIIWIVLSILLGLYFLGKLNFAHDSESKGIGFPQFMLSLISFVFAMYLFTGLFGAPLKNVSAMLPPRQGDELSFSAKNNQESLPANVCELPKYVNILHLPYGLKGYFDYQQGLACAKRLNKPVFLDFNGHACSNCKKMEAEVWSDNQVLQKLASDFVIIALYVDDKTQLPESEWIVSAFDGKQKKTIGSKNADIQISKYKTNTQPYYLILDTAGNTLSGPYGLNTNKNDFLQFLEEGVQNFRTAKSLF